MRQSFRPSTQAAPPDDAQRCARDSRPYRGQLRSIPRDRGSHTAAKNSPLRIRRPPRTLVNRAPRSSETPIRSNPSLPQAENHAEPNANQGGSGTRLLLIRSRPPTPMRVTRQTHDLAATTAPSDAPHKFPGYDRLSRSGTPELDGNSRRHPELSGYSDQGALTSSDRGKADLDSGERAC